MSLGKKMKTNITKKVATLGLLTLMCTTGCSTSMSGVNTNYSVNDISNISWSEKMMKYKKQQWQIENEIVRDGNKSWKFTLQNGWCTSDYKHSDCATDRQRSEIMQKNYSRITSKPFWYSVSIYVPHSYKSLGNGFPGKKSPSSNWVQLHQTNAHSYAILREKGSNEGINFDIMPNGDTVHRIYVGELNQFKGKWTDIKIHAKYSRNNDGFYVLYINNKKIGEYNGRTLSSLKRGDGTIRMDLGIYQSRISKRSNKTAFPTQILYYDAVKVSHNLEDIGPNQN